METLINRKKPLNRVQNNNGDNLKFTITASICNASYIFIATTINYFILFNSSNISK